ncbi:MAG: putative aromatic acid decarboxylase [Candidatus Heimdallarchaeota archaeon LC_3]|nr:MAG: putative aromatic acid decarboxylase [Candidatus Heimdallarchaeota archaeon LC_3]
MKKIIVALTGASGIGYGLKLIDVLLNLHYNIHLVVSKGAEIVAKIEEGIELDRYKENKNIQVFSENNIAASIASGSYLTNGMIICPCSVKTLGLIANGLETNLIARSASVCLKERRRLVLVIRETPFSLPIIENMKKAFLAGATILPAIPGFYHKPKTIEDLQNFLVGKILDQMEIEHNLYKRWGE